MEFRVLYGNCSESANSVMLFSHADDICNFTPETSLVSGKSRGKSNSKKQILFIQLHKIKRFLTNVLT